MGGLFFHSPAHNYDQGLKLILLSDLHLGSSLVNEDLIKADLEWAVAEDARIAINGDLADCILPGDKRYSPECLVPKLRGRRDMLNASKDYVVSFLAPYKDRIDLVGIGNHETKLEKVNSYDLGREVSDALGATYGGYTGVLEYALGRHRYTIFYHHGSGKGNSVRSAAEGLQRKIGWMRADLYWQGHHHCRFNTSEVVLSPNRNGTVKAQEVRCVVTGAYMEPYQVQTRKSFQQSGRQGSYPSDAGLSPHGLGGALVQIEVEKKGLKVRITQ